MNTHRISYKLMPSEAVAHFEVQDSTPWLRSSGGVRIDDRPVGLVKQVHGANGVEYLPPFRADRSEADYIFTRQQGVGVGVFVADCTAALIFGEDSAGSFLVAIHAGWRGTAEKIFEKALAQFSKPKRLVAWLGPSICSQCYEVGEEVVEKLPGSKKFCVESRPGHYFLDLKAFQMNQLEELGVQVTASSLCTSEQAEFFSYRQMKGQLSARHLAWACLI